MNLEELYENEYLIETYNKVIEYCLEQIEIIQYCNDELILEDIEVFDGE